MIKRDIDKQVDCLVQQLDTFKKKTQKDLETRKEGLQLGRKALESFAMYSQELMSTGSQHLITIMLSCIADNTKKKFSRLKLSYI